MYLAEGACKPGSVLHVIIYLGCTLLHTSCVQPENLSEGYSVSRLVLLFGLAPGGVCRALFVTNQAVRSYRTISPLLIRTKSGKRYTFCCTFPKLSLAGRYPAPYLHGARTFLPLSRVMTQPPISLYNKLATMGMAD